MMDGSVHASLPRAGAAREKLREKGQFWTPDWVADAMVAWAAAGSDHLFDPGVGTGAFFTAAKRQASRDGRQLSLMGTELDSDALGQALGNGLLQSDLSNIIIADFMTVSFDQRFRAVVGNPPYMRHHRFTPEYKAMLREFGRRVVGKELDGRAGLHVFFLLKSLTLLQEGGRLAFIVPADICEGRFAPALWDWIGRTHRIDGVVTFAPDATPFPGVDTNPVILMLSSSRPAATLRWARVVQPRTVALKDWMSRGLPAVEQPGLEAVERDTDEALATGLTRPPRRDTEGKTTLLGELFKVIRGVATGDNEFFFMTSQQKNELRIPDKVFLRAIGRTRDHTDGPILTSGHLDALDQRGRPTYLLSLGREERGSLPPEVQAYLTLGERRGLPKRPLIAQRKPWYRMETRRPPPWLFSYLGRRTCRFISNEAGAVPLTGFLCLYPAHTTVVDRGAAITVLNDPRTLANLHRVAKSYGGGALKVEPRNLERLPIPNVVLAEHGLRVPEQGRLL